MTNRTKTLLAFSIFLALSALPLLPFVFAGSVVLVNGILDSSNPTYLGFSPVYSIAFSHNTTLWSTTTYRSGTLDNPPLTQYLNGTGFFATAATPPTVIISNFTLSEICLSVTAANPVAITIYSLSGYAEVNHGDFDPGLTVTYPAADTTRVVIDHPVGQIIVYTWSNPVNPNQMESNQSVLGVFWLTMAILSLLPISLSFATFASFRNGNLDVKLLVATIAAIVFYVVLMLLAYMVLINMGNAL